MTDKSILEHVHKHGISEGDIYGAYKIFFGTMVSEPRLKIINLLRHAKKNVSEIVNELNMDQTSVSHDLARLKRCGFVKCISEGKYRYYILNEETIRPLMSLIDKHMNAYCVHILREENEPLERQAKNLSVLKVPKIIKNIK